MQKIRLPHIKSGSIVDPYVLRIPLTYLVSAPIPEYNLSMENVIYVSTSRSNATNKRINIYADGKKLVMSAGIMEELEWVGTVIGIEKNV